MKMSDSSFYQLTPIKDWRSLQEFTYFSLLSTQDLRDTFNSWTKYLVDSNHIKNKYYSIIYW